MNFLQGEIIAIDKPYRMSSFGALAHIRYLLSHHLGQRVKVRVMAVDRLMGTIDFRLEMEGEEDEWLME